MKVFAVCALLLASLSSQASWLYNDDVDEMTSKRTTHAILESSNSLDLGFPYKGKNNARLVVRQHPRYKLGVIFSIDKGQLLCHNDNCAIKIRFDDKQPMTFAGTGPADHSTTHIFLSNPSKFIGEASKAKKILVQANIYHNGSPVLQFFAPEPLKWAPKK